MESDDSSPHSRTSLISGLIRVGTVATDADEKWTVSLRDLRVLLFKQESAESAKNAYLSQLTRSDLVTDVSAAPGIWQNSRPRVSLLPLPPSCVACRNTVPIPAEPSCWPAPS